MQCVQDGWTETPEAKTKVRGQGLGMTTWKTGMLGVIFRAEDTVSRSDWLLHDFVISLFLSNTWLRWLVVNLAAQHHILDRPVDCHSRKKKDSYRASSVDITPVNLNASPKISPNFPKTRTAVPWACSAPQFLAWQKLNRSIFHRNTRTQIHALWLQWHDHQNIRHIKYCYGKKRPERESPPRVHAADLTLSR